MSSALGCLFVLFLAIPLLAFGLLQMFLTRLFGGKQQRTQYTYTNGRQRASQSSYTSSTSGTSAGNARHEGSRQNSRQRRSGKIFAKNEGEYIDFEEV